MKNRRKSLIKYGITTIIGAIMVYATISLHGYSLAVTLADKYRILADAFTIPGVVIMLCGVLVAVSNEGAFEGISYAMSYAMKMLIPGMGANRHEKYGDYVERKREKGGVKGYGFLFIVGGVFMIIALVFIALFYSVY